MIFPVSGQVGNTICIVDFNTDDGIIALENVYGADICRTDGRYTISGLKPGGIYLLAMTWSNNGGQYNRI